jgi:hypothetical protein
MPNLLFSLFLNSLFYLQFIISATMIIYCQKNFSSVSGWNYYSIIKNRAWEID